MSEIDIIKYYNKFCEDKRLNSRHGQVEFAVTMEYLKKHIKNFENKRIIDIGAGTGKYSYELLSLGADVTAVELVKYNLGILKKKGNGLKAYQGDARNLKRFKDDSFDVALLFGPMYHLLSHDEKVKALAEAKRIVKRGGLIFVSYLMNEYAILVHGFRDNNILKSIEEERVGENFEIKPQEPDLYSYIRIEDIDSLNSDVGLARVQIIAQDGPTDYMREVLNRMDEKTFKLFLDYQLKMAERTDLIGASSHVLDILKK